MTAIRDHADLDEGPTGPAWDERPIVGNSRGLTWWAAVLLAFGLAAVAAVVDMQRQDSLSRIYQGAYIVGCVVAVCWVRRRNLFGPMVQPPLVFAVTAIGAVALAGSGLGGGLKQLIFSVALPLTSNFPTMAITTGVTVAIGLFRLIRQRDPDPPIRSSRREPVGALADRSGGRDRRDGRPARSADPAEPASRRLRDRTRSGRGRAEGDRQRGRSTRSADDWEQLPPTRRGGAESPPPDRRSSRQRTGGSADPNRRQPNPRRREAPDPRRQPRRRPD